MAKIVRYNGNLVPFASASLGTERTLFGEVTQADDITSQYTADFLRGWGIVGPSDQPTLQDFNAVAYTNGMILSYLHQVGVAEYNALQEYHIGSLCNVSGELYSSLTNNNIGNTPSLSPASWSRRGLGRLIAKRVYTSSGSYTPTDGTNTICVRGCGGGGGGASVSASGVDNTAIGAGSGGSSGNFAEATYAAAGISGISVTIGAGGTPGNNGGTTSFGGLLTLLGGPFAPAVTITPGANNAGDNGLQTAGPSGTGIIFGSSGEGGGLAVVPQPATLCRSGFGGSTPYGSGGRGIAGSQPGVNGFGYGSGGGGACNATFSQPARLGGTGAPGILIIEEYA